jgi:4-deoxy-L-threo-5-hexosulose-uronate ketol-isomerase
MKTILMADPVRYPRMTTAELRETFLIDDLFKPNEIVLNYVDVDRTIVGSAVPGGGETLTLGTADQLRAAYFLERREIGILNIGAPGAVRVGATRHEMGTLDCLYIGLGEREISFENGPSGSAQFYFISTPAHAKHPTTHATRTQASANPIGDPARCNRRRIVKYIHPDGIKSCQLVMGFTELESGSVWNTMPPHTHSRRTEIYFYFDLGGEIVFHLLGEPHATRHLVVHDRQVALSPSWSIHAGVGTGSYRFVWAMGGDNQVFADMDQVALTTLK